MLCNHLILCCPLLLLPSVFLSIGVFANVSALRIKWPKYWSFSFSISPSNEYSRLIFFRIDWFDFLALYETLRSSPAPQFKNINFLAFCLPYMTVRETIALTIWTSVGKVIPLLFNMQSRFAIDFLPRNKWLLNFMAAVTLCSDFGAQDIYLEFDIIYIWLMYILIRHIIYLLNVWLSKWLRFHGSSQPKEIYNVVQEIKNHYDEMPLKWGEWQWGQKMHLEGRGDGLWGQLRLHGWAGSKNHWDPAPWFFPLEGLLPSHSEHSLLPSQIYHPPPFGIWKIWKYLIHT